MKIMEWVKSKAQWAAFDIPLYIGVVLITAMNSPQEYISSLAVVALCGVVYFFGRWAYIRFILNNWFVERSTVEYLDKTKSVQFDALEQLIAEDFVVVLGDVVSYNDSVETMSKKLAKKAVDVIRREL